MRKRKSGAWSPIEIAALLVLGLLASFISNDYNGKIAGRRETAGYLLMPESSGEIAADAGGPDAEPGTGEKSMLPGDSPTVALTFDDGPHRIYTEKLLDGLAERDVRAAFFVIGKNITGNEALIQRMHEEGHIIGNHTYSHIKICDLSGPAACEELEKTSSLIREITGRDTEFVRPPFGAWNKEMECSFTMIPVLWDVDPLDWTTENTSLVVERVMKNVKDGDIILLHDCYDSSVEAALQIVDQLKAQGYRFVTVDELIL